MERALEAKAETEKRKGSGWEFDKISSKQLCVYKTFSLTGGG